MHSASCTNTQNDVTDFISTQLDAIQLGVSAKDEKPTEIEGKALTSFYQIWKYTCSDATPSTFNSS